MKKIYVRPLCEKVGKKVISKIKSIKCLGKKTEDEEAV